MSCQNDALIAELMAQRDKLRRALSMRTTMTLGHHAQHYDLSGEDGTWVCIRFNTDEFAFEAERLLAGLGLTN